MLADEYYKRSVQTSIQMCREEDWGSSDEYIAKVSKLEIQMGLMIIAGK